MSMSPFGRRTLPKLGRGWVALAIVALSMLLSACSPEQLMVLEAVNRERVEQGGIALAPSPHAMVKAQRWAEELARSENLRHSDLREGMPAGFLVLGENVGRGGSIEAVLDGFIASRAHHENLLDRRYQWGGTGVAVAASGAVYVVEVFARY